jgi:serine/threonine-protein kinase
MEIGSIVKNRYIIKEKIGSGGMADVYLVQDKIIKKDFAMKMMKPEEDIKVSKSIQRFKAEANVLAKMRSSNIVKIHDAFLEKDAQGTRKYIVMEYVDGITLQKYMKQQGILNNKEAIKLAGQALYGLKEMHEKKLFHRDIKPQNILITHDGIIKLIDFGIVKTPDSEDLTKTGSVVGSVQYIAPEILGGDKESAASDIYSTGIIFYTMLTGVIPFNGTNIQKILKEKLSKSPEPIRNFNEKVDVKLATIVMKSISREVEYRYQSCEEMLKDIKRYLENKPLLSTTQLRKQQVLNVEENFLVEKRKRINPNTGKIKKASTITMAVQKRVNRKRVGLAFSVVGLLAIIALIIAVIVLIV